jgi:hypothetical protein
LPVALQTFDSYRVIPTRMWRLQVALAFPLMVISRAAGLRQAWGKLGEPPL